MRFKFLRPLAIACSLAASTLLANGTAQAADDGPVTLLVGFAPGGTSDGVSRLIAQHLPARLGRPVIVENKPGAIGTLAIKSMIATQGSRPIFAVLPFSSLIFPALTMTSANYDVFKDLKTVASLTSYPIAAVVGQGTAVKTPKDLVDWYKAHPEKAQFGTAGAGGHNHFLGLELGNRIGVKTTVVSYNGNGPMLTDLIAGHVPTGLMVAGDAWPYVKDQRLSIVGVLTAERSPLMPDVPTFREAGFDVTAGEAWYGMWTGSQTDDASIAKMRTALKAVLDMPEVIKAMVDKYAMQADFRAGAATAERLKADYDYWAPVIQASGFKAN